MRKRTECMVGVNELSQGTAAGFHQYDSKVEDYSAATMNRRIATLHWLQGQLDSVRAPANKLAENGTFASGAEILPASERRVPVPEITCS